MPTGLTTIEALAFASCTSLSNVKLPEGLTTIGNNAFYFCMSLTSIELPDSINNIIDYPFEFCGYIEEIIVSPGTYAEEWALGMYPDRIKYSNKKLRRKRWQ